MDIKELAHEVFPYVVEMRRDFHMNPEPSFEEHRTTKRIAEELDKMGIPYRLFEPTGLIGEIKGGKPGKCIALRADIDALSIQEKTGLPYASQKEGYMHACGHDTHTAMLLGAAKMLVSVKDELCGTVKLIFQPAEELASGAKHIVAQGALDGVDAAFGQHIFSGIPAGTVAIGEGALLPAADYFRIDVKGKASHGALPDEGIDATVAASAIVLALQTVSSREYSPLDPVVVTVGTLHSGARFNIVSGEAVLEGTARVFNKEMHERMPEILGRIAENTAAAYRCEAKLDYQFKTEILVNEEKMTAIARGAAAKLVPEDKHCIDEQAMETGSALYAQVAVDYLNG